MTLAMPDSIIPPNLPAGYGQYLVYVDGLWSTAAEVGKLHPQAQLLRMTVSGSTLNADGIDCEPGDVTAAAAAAWVKRKLASAPASRPVVYADLASEGCSMTEVLAELGALGIVRLQVRLLTAHYGKQHICSPANGCRDAQNKLITFTADGTQWTETYPGAGGSLIDMSELSSSFFTPASGFGPPQNLTVRPGDGSVLVQRCDPPAVGPGPVDHYEIGVYTGSYPSQATQVKSYPRQMKHAPEQFGSLQGIPSGTHMTLRATAYTASGAASTYADVHFEMP